MIEHSAIRLPCAIKLKVTMLLIARQSTLTIDSNHDQQTALQHGQFVMPAMGIRQLRVSKIFEMKVCYTP